jgi:hypothetical protein
MKQIISIILMFFIYNFAFSQVKPDTVALYSKTDSVRAIGNELDLVTVKNMVKTPVTVKFSLDKVNFGLM